MLICPCFSRTLNGSRVESSDYGLVWAEWGAISSLIVNAVKVNKIVAKEGDEMNDSGRFGDQTLRCFTIWTLIIL